MITEQMVKEAMAKCPEFTVIPKTYGIICKDEGCLMTLLYMASGEAKYSDCISRAALVRQWADMKFGKVFVDWFILGFDGFPYIGIALEHHLAWSNGKEIWKLIFGLTRTSAIS